MRDDWEIAQQALLDQFLETTRHRSWANLVEWLAGTIASEVSEALELDPENPPDLIMNTAIINADHALRCWLLTDGDANSPLLD